MNRTTMRVLLLSGLASAGMLVAACASGPAGAGSEPAPPTAPSDEPAGAAAAAPAPQAVHPRVSFNRTCVECHERRTPEAVESWRESVHGQTNVGCFICHGDAEEEFMVRPEPELCQSCHAGELDDYEVVDGHTFRFINR